MQAKGSCDNDACDAKVCCDKASCEDVGDVECAPPPHRFNHVDEYTRAVIMVMVATTFHATLAGLSLGIADNTGTVRMIGYAILSHKLLVSTPRPPNTPNLRLHLVLTCARTPRKFGRCSLVQGPFSVAQTLTRPISQQICLTLRGGGWWTLQQVSFSIGLRCVQAQIQPMVCVGLIAMFAAATPVGIGIGIATHQAVSYNASAVINALSAGCFLYMGTSEVAKLSLAETSRECGSQQLDMRERLLRSGCLMLGVCAILVSVATEAALATGDPHDHK
jgi:hypothetical protein